MRFYEKKDLIYEYSWTVAEDDDPKITGKPDSTLLNRSEGYEVLYFINAFAEIHDFINKKTGKKIETMLQEHVPGNIRSQENIKNWITINWKDYR